MPVPGSFCCRNLLTSKRDDISSHGPFRRLWDVSCTSFDSKGRFVYRTSAALLPCWAYNYNRFNTNRSGENAEFASSRWSSTKRELYATLLLSMLQFRQPSNGDSRCIAPPTGRPRAHHKTIRLSRWMSAGRLEQRCFKSATKSIGHRLTVIHWVVVLRPTQHKKCHFWDVSSSRSLGLVWKKTKLNSTKARIHQSKEMYYNTK